MAEAYGDVSSRQTALSHKFTFCDIDDVRFGSIEGNLLQRLPLFLYKEPKVGFGSANAFLCLSN
jgi:hypothetical protein